MRTARGQMILIAAIVVAVTILGSVVLLNVLHVPADINTQQDARSLASVEGTTEQVAGDLERLFLTHTSVTERDEPVPYAEETGGPDPDFAAVVAEYSAVNADLTASDASRIVSVDYLSDGSQSGTLLRHNDSTRQFSDDGNPLSLISGADSIPYFHLHVTGTNESGSEIDSNPFVVDVEGETLEFGERTVENGSGIVVEGADNDDLYPVEVEIIDGVVEVRNGTARKSYELGPVSDYDVEFRNGNETNGRFTMSGTDVSGWNLDDPGANYQYQEGGIVNPKFRINVTDASVTHSTTFALYNGTQP